jgi:hypothetical protein
MAIQTTEQQFVHSTDKEFQAFMGEKLNQMIQNVLHDALVEKGWDGSIELINWKASFDVTFIQETYEDEE